MPRKRNFMNKAFIPLVFIGGLLVCLAWYPTLSSGQEYGKQPLRADSSSENLRKFKDKRVAESLDIARDKYNLSRQYVYFRPVESSEGIQYVTDESRLQLREANLFRNIDSELLLTASGKDLQKSVLGMKVRTYNITKDPMRLIKKVYESFLKENPLPLDYPGVEESENVDAEDSSDTFEKIMRSDPITESNMFRLIPIIPDQEEEFSLNSFFNFRPAEKSELDYPGVLDILTDMEKFILFKHFMLLFTIDNKGQGSIDHQKFRAGLDTLYAKYASQFETGADPILINSSFLSLARMLFSRPSFYYSSPDDPEIKAVREFYAKKIMTNEAEVAQIDDWVEQELKKPEMIAVLNYDNRYSEEELVREIDQIRFYRSQEFLDEFESIEGIAFDKYLDKAIHDKNRRIEDPTIKMPSWLKEKYKIDFDLRLYNVVQRERLSLKMTRVIKRYIEDMLERAKAEDPGFDLLEYVQTRGGYLPLLVEYINSRIDFLLAGSGLLK